MNVMYWNARGINHSHTQRTLKEMCASHKPNILCISEPMVAFDTIPWYFWISIGMKLVTCNKRGDLIPNFLVFHSVSTLMLFSIPHSR